MYWTHRVNRNVLYAVVMLVDDIINVITIVTVDELKILASLLYAQCKQDNKVIFANQITGI